MADNQDYHKEQVAARGALLFRSLRQGGAEEHLAYAATQEVIDMAGHNTTAVLGAKIDALRWMLAAVLALLAALTALGIISLRTAPAPAPPAVMQAAPATPQDAVPASPVDSSASQGQR